MFFENIRNQTFEFMDKLKFPYYLFAQNFYFNFNLKYLFQYKISLAIKLLNSHEKLISHV